MNQKRQRILTILFALVVGGVLFYQFVWPELRPMLDYEERIEAKHKELADLQELDADYRRARRQYRQFVERVGDYDPSNVQHEIKKRLDELLVKHRIQDGKASPPRRLSTDKRMKTVSLSFSVSGEGPLRQCVEFVKDVSALPFLVKAKRIKFDKLSSGRDAKRDLMSLNLSLEFMVVPKQRLAKVKLDELQQPQEFVRYARADYSPIWDRKPFLDYEKPTSGIKTRPDTTPVVKNEHKKETPTTDTQEVVVDKNPVVEPWRDRGQLQLTMTMMVDDGSDKLAEVMLYDTRKKDTRYIRQGEEFDGGEMLCVRQQGVLVERGDERFVYPIGELLSASLPVEQAEGYPYLQYASRRIDQQRREEAARQREAEQKQRNQKTSAAKPGGPEDAAVAMTVKAGDKTEPKAAASAKDATPNPSPEDITRTMEAASAMGDPAQAGAAAAQQNPGAQPTAGKSAVAAPAKPRRERRYAGTIAKLMTREEFEVRKEELSAMSSVEFAEEVQRLALARRHAAKKTNSPSAPSDGKNNAAAGKADKDAAVKKRGSQDAGPRRGPVRASSKRAESFPRRFRRPVRGQSSRDRLLNKSMLKVPTSGKGDGDAGEKEAGTGAGETKPSTDGKAADEKTAEKKAADKKAADKKTAAESSKPEEKEKAAADEKSDDGSASEKKDKTSDEADGKKEDASPK